MTAMVAILNTVSGDRTAVQQRGERERWDGRLEFAKRCDNTFGVSCLESALCNFTEQFPIAEGLTTLKT